MGGGESDRGTLARLSLPIPARLEAPALWYAWLIVAIYLAGTAFGFWYYRFQFAQTPVVFLG